MEGDLKELPDNIGLDRQQVISSWWTCQLLRIRMSTPKGQNDEVKKWLLSASGDEAIQSLKLGGGTWGQACLGYCVNWHASPQWSSSLLRFKRCKPSIDHGPGLENCVIDPESGVLVSGNDDLLKTYSFSEPKVIWPAGSWKMNFLKKLTKKDSSNSLGQGTKTKTLFESVQHICLRWLWRCFPIYINAKQVVWATSVRQRQPCRILS